MCLEKRYLNMSKVCVCVELTDDNVGIWCVCMSCHEPSWKCLIDLVVYVKVCLVYSYIVMSGIDWDDSIVWLHLVVTQYS